MTHPASLLAVPVFVSNPVGWAVLGVSGYLLYKAGKKSGAAAERGIDQPSLADRTIKGAMKTAYKTKTKLDNSLAKTKDKYSEMWNEVRTEAEAPPSQP